nr:hypothetical protein [Tanacetum cinerariifolium]
MENGMDHISKLPDPILHLILSRLDSTIDVVQTSVLSTRWKYLWTSVPSLDINLFSKRTYWFNRNVLGFREFVDARIFKVTGWVPHVLVTCRSRQIDDENVPLNYYINNDLHIQFGREEFCLVTGLRFRVENREEYDTQANLPFRRRVFSLHLDGQHITGIDVANAIASPTFAELYNDVAVGLCCLGILQLVSLGAESRRNVPEWNTNVRRWGGLYVDQPTNEDDPTTYSIFGYTWAFKTWILESFRVTAIRYFGRFNRYHRVAAWSKKKGRFLAKMVIPFFEGNILAVRLTPNDNEARSDWWISSRAYFDGFIDQVERVPFDLRSQNMYEIPSDIYRQFVEQKIKLERNRKDVDDIKEQTLKFKEEMNARSVRQENTVPINVRQHYEFSDFSQFQSMQGGLSSFKGHANSLFFNMGTPSNFRTPMQSEPGLCDWQRQMPEQSASQYWQPSPQPGSYYSFGQVPSHIGRLTLQTTIETQHDVHGLVDQNILNRGKWRQLPSKYLVTPFTEQPPTTIVPKQRVFKNKNKGKKVNLSRVNLGGVLEGYNAEDNNVTFLGAERKL